MLAHDCGRFPQSRQTIKAQKTFVDRVDLNVRTIATQNRHDPITHVAIKRVVRRQANDAVLSYQLLHLEPRCAHLDTQGFYFVLARYSAAVIIGEYDDRSIDQGRIESTFTADVHVIDIHQGEQLLGRITGYARHSSHLEFTYHGRHYTPDNKVCLISNFDRRK